MFYTSYQKETREAIARVKEHLMACTRGKDNLLDNEKPNVPALKHGTVRAA